MRSDKGGGWRRRRGEGPPTLYTRFPVIWSARPWWRSPTAPREDHPLHRGRTASGPLSRRPGSTRGCWSPKSHSWHLNTVLSLPGVAASLVGGKRPLPRTFQRSRWGQNSKLRWHRAAPVHHCSRWLSKAKKGLGGGSSLSHHSNVSLSQIDQKLLSGRSHLSSSAAHGLLRMLPFLGCGSNETSILDLT